MQGELVIVRAYGDEPLVRRLWETTPEAVYICSEENYQNLISGKPAMNAVGVHREYVFRYEPAIAEELLENYESTPGWWWRLTPWSE
jgi:hypothetical protein